MTGSVLPKIFIPWLYFRMRCRQCQIDKPETDFYRPHKDKLCKKCHSVNVREKRKTDRPKHNALRAASRSRRPWDVRYLNDVTRWSRERAKGTGIEWDLSREFLKELWAKQDAKCALSLVPFRPVEEKGKATMFSPSLDRINPNGGYTKNNVRFILHGLNTMKGKSSDEDLVNVCRAVVENN